VVSEASCKWRLVLSSSSLCSCREHYTLSRHFPRLFSCAAGVSLVVVGARIVGEVVVLAWKIRRLGATTEQVKAFEAFYWLRRPFKSISPSLFVALLFQSCSYPLSISYLPFIFLLLLFLCFEFSLLRLASRPALGKRRLDEWYRERSRLLS
jgi:hypothetical protein